MPSQLGIVMEYAAGGDLRVSWADTLPVALNVLPMAWFGMWCGQSPQQLVRVRATG